MVWWTSTLAACRSATRTACSATIRWRKLGPQLDEKSRYLNAFLKETDILEEPPWRGPHQGARSVLVGGGTPTFLSVDQLRKFLDGFCERTDLSQCRQFNYDVDPNTLIGPGRVPSVSP